MAATRVVTDMGHERMELPLDDVVDPTTARVVRYSDLQYQIRSLIQRSGDDPDVTQRDWSDAVASAIVVSLIDEGLRSTRWIAREQKGQVNLLLYRMSYEIWLACEFAHHHASGNAPYSKSFLKELEKLENMEHEDTVGDIAQILCRVLIIIHQARNSYDYVSIDIALDECTRLLPLCNLIDFKVLQCFQIVAAAGRSRESLVGTTPNVAELERLANGVSIDRDHGAGPYADHALMVLISAVGHRKRSDLVSDIHAKSRDGQRDDDGTISVASGDWIGWMVERLGRLSEQWRYSKDVDCDNVTGVMKHDLHYYQYYAHHVQAIAAATLPESQLSGSLEQPISDHADADKLLSEVRRYYDRASDEIERALRNVPSSNYSRWLYYNVTAEALEHETNLRMAMLRHELKIDKTVSQLRETVTNEAIDELKKRVESVAEVVRQELRNQMADMSSRIVEIIGVFLAIVAILATTIMSSTAGDLSVSQRLIILVVGGILPIAYFALLRSIIDYPGRTKIGFFSWLRNPRGEGLREGSKVGAGLGGVKSPRSKDDRDDDESVHR